MPEKIPETFDIERKLLNLLTKSKITLKRNFSKVRRDLFSGKQRLFIYDAMNRKYLESKSILTDKILEYEIESYIEEADRFPYASEWEYIKNAEVPESIESLVDILEEVQLKENISDYLESAAELLISGEVHEAATFIKRGSVDIASKKESSPSTDFTDYSEREKRIRDMKANPDKYSGINTGFKFFDSLTGGLFRTEYTLFAAITGVGKSTIMKAFGIGIISSNEKPMNVLHITNEESKLQVEQKYDSISTRLDYNQYKRATISDEDIDKWTEKLDELKDTQKFGQLIIKELPAFSDATDIEREYYELEAKGIKIDVIILDYLQHLSPVQKAWSENDERIKASTDCKELAKNLNVAFVAAQQAATALEKKQEKGQKAGKLDVYGAKGQLFPVNTFMIINAGGKDDTQIDREEWERDVYWTVECKKNRDGPPFYFDAKHHVRDGYVEAILSTTTIVTTELDKTIEAGEEVVETSEMPEEAEIVEPEEVKVDEVGMGIMEKIRKRREMEEGV